MTELPSETARQNALDRFDRSERRFYFFLFLLSAVEVLFLWGCAQLAESQEKRRVRPARLDSGQTVEARIAPKSPGSHGQETTGVGHFSKAVRNRVLRRRIRLTNRRRMKVKIPTSCGVRLAERTPFAECAARASIGRRRVPECQLILWHPDFSA
jgi:hypothetical protein